MFQVSNLMDYLRGSVDRSFKASLPRIDTSFAKNGDGILAPPPTPVDAAAASPEEERFVPVRLSSGPTEPMFYTPMDLEALLAVYPNIHRYPDDETFAELCNYLGWELPESEIVIESVKWTIIMKMRATIENTLTQLGFVDLHQVDVTEFQGEYVVHAFCPAPKEKIDVPAFLQIPYVCLFSLEGCGCDEEELSYSSTELSKSKLVESTKEYKEKGQPEPQLHGSQEDKIPTKESVLIPKVMQEKVSPILSVALSLPSPPGTHTLCQSIETCNSRGDQQNQSRPTGRIGDEVQPPILPCYWKIPQEIQSSSSSASYINQVARFPAGHGNIVGSSSNGGVISDERQGLLVHQLKNML